MTEPKNTENVAGEFDEKLHKLSSAPKSSAGCYGRPSFPNWSLRALNWPPEHLVTDG